jgi:hypothetical protein
MEKEDKNKMQVSFTSILKFNKVSGTCIGYVYVHSAFISTTAGFVKST